MPLKGLSLTGHAGSRPRPKGLRTIAAAPTGAGVSAAATLTPGSVPQNLRAIASTDSTLDGSLVWDGTPATTALGTLVRYELRAYLRSPALSVTAGTTRAQIPAGADDHKPQWTVQAVYSMNGMETASRQSNVCMTCRKLIPTPSYYAGATLPSGPTGLTATPLWNEGQPLIHLEWAQTSQAQYCRVDRDGQTVADGLFVLEYTDHNLVPGSTHTYQVFREVLEIEPSLYSPPVSITATALSAPPPETLNLSGPTPANLTFYAYDGNVIAEVDAPYGNYDLRVHKSGSPDQVKFAGANPSIGFTTIQRRYRIAIQIDVALGGADYVFEFVDKFGPDSPMNLSAAEMAAMGMTGAPINTNGHGPPCFVPVPVGPALVQHFDGMPQAGCFSSLRGDTSRGLSLLFHAPAQATFTPVLYANLPLDIKGAYDAVNSGTWPANADTDIGSPDNLAVQESPDLYMGKSTMNRDDTKAFGMSGHLMWFAAEGGGPGSPFPPHTMNGAVYFQAKQPFTLAPGETVRLFLNGDNQLGPRNWWDFFIKAAADPFPRPGKFFEFNRRPTFTGNLFRTEFLGSTTAMVIYPPDSPFAGASSGDRTQSSAPNFKFNQLISSTSNLGFADWHNDLGQEMEVTLQYRASDGAVKCRVRRCARYTNDLTKQGGQANVGFYEEVLSHDFDPLMVWPWWQAPQTSLVGLWEHLVYHTTIDARQEGMDYNPFKRFEINRRPYQREKHVRAMGYDLFAIPTGQSAAPF